MRPEMMSGKRMILVDANVIYHLVSVLRYPLLGEPPPLVSVVVSLAFAAFMAVAALVMLVSPRSLAAASRVDHSLFQTSAHCLACHSKVSGPDGQDISIAYQWRATMMANSSRDPYWQASIRRETLDHPRGTG